MAVGPDGRARYVSPPYVGCVHDMKIFKNHIDEHIERLMKDDGEERINEHMTVDHLDENEMWGAMMDKGYEGARKFGRFIMPKKKTKKRELDATDKRRNGRIKNDRVMVENFFGRLKTL